jgi:MATE family multidrug resistance protein
MFVAKGSEMGANVLAANAVLFQLQYIIAYFYDGLGNASSVFAGKCVGENNLPEFRKVLHISGVSTAVLSVTMALIALLFQRQSIAVFTNLPQVIALCQEYVLWIAAFPLVIGIGLVYYGVFTGATYTAPVRNSMLLSLLAFLLVYFVTIPRFQNHGLWLAFITFSLGRSLMLFLCRNTLIAARFPS